MRHVSSLTSLSTDSSEQRIFFAISFILICFEFISVFFFAFLNYLETSISLTLFNQKIN